MKKILITGGPVFAYLDDVKIITNKFKGGLMANLASKFIERDCDISISDSETIEVIYLCAKGSKEPTGDLSYCQIMYHNGIEDYMYQVRKYASNMDAIVLGAAVANLIPKNRIKGKFPSHNHKPGDTIPIDFTIAPRIIDEVKKVNPNVHLFGYKLLSGVDYYELIDAAYGVLLESKAVTVFANDAKDLMQKYAVTKERGVHPIHNDGVINWIIDRMYEKYYSTVLPDSPDSLPESGEAKADIKIWKARLKKIIDENKNSFIKVDEGFVFGSAAMLFQPNGQSFITTARGKNEIDDFAFVNSVDHQKREVYCAKDKKASLNAPLFHYIFTHFSVDYILHFHHQREDLMTLPYATPGTDKDSTKRALTRPSFNIRGHGCILSFVKDGMLLK